jgi:Carbohydrate-binding family 9
MPLEFSEAGVTIPAMKSIALLRRGIEWGRKLFHGRGCGRTGLLLLGLPLTLSAAEPGRDPATLPAPKRVSIPQLTGTVTLDGELNEGVWRQAAVLAPFAVSDDASPERERTRVLAWYDAEALYLGWRCEDTDIQATFVARDSKFWEEEVAEFFVTPKDLGRYYELQWNPLNGMFDAIIVNELDDRGVSRKFDGDWNYTAAGMKSAVKVVGTVGEFTDRDRFWQVEVRIPFADLQQATPKPGDVWRANFYRYNRTYRKEPQLVAWSPTLLPGFHQPSRFGYLEFGGTR